MPNKQASEQLKAKYQRLREILSSFKKVIVAYSGGVDSVFLLRTTIESVGSEKVLACIGDSESLARGELKSARDQARQMGANLEVVFPREMSNQDYRANPANRCYYCKSELYRLLSELAEREGYDVVLCGTNADDYQDFRPGMEAAKKFNVVSPLEEAGLTKEDIRTLSRQLGLTTWQKPSQPCLASRIAYGLEVTAERLKQVEDGENFLRGLGFQRLRVRHHGNLVRIEVAEAEINKLADEELRREIVAFFKKLGFSYVSCDLQGFRSGSANESL